MKPSRNRNFSDLSSKARKNTDVFSITVGKAPEVAIDLHGCSRYANRCKSTKDKKKFFFKSQSRKIKDMKTTKRKATKQLSIIEIKVRFKGQGQLEM